MDSTWFFALNYAAVHHLIVGHDFYWTYGPLTYLLLPFDLGSNLALGLLSQTLIWITFGFSLSGLIFEKRLQLINLAIFSLLLVLTSINYHQNIYPGNLLLCSAFILLVHYFLYRGTARLIIGLIILGIMPAFAFAGVIVASAAVFGLVVERLLSSELNSRRDAILAAVVPPLVGLLFLLFTLESFSAINGYIRSSLELGAGYSFAMSRPHEPITVIVIALTFGLFATILLFLPWVSRRAFRFFTLIFLVPVCAELRHGLIRPDMYHVLQFLSMTALVLALIALVPSFEKPKTRTVAAVAIPLFTIFWLLDAAGRDLKATIASISGVKTPQIIFEILHYDSLRRQLQTAGQEAIPATARTEPEIANIIGEQSVGFLSNVYNNAFVEKLNLVLFPVIQRYSAYTPYLDELNAQWVIRHGPRYLLFNADEMDDRHPWTDEPATWLETYRWYNTRVVGSRNLLLERRDRPRFDHLELTERRDVRFGEKLPISAAQTPMFWKMNCSLSTEGRLRVLTYRVGVVTMTASEPSGLSTTHRVSLPTLASPSIANYLPSSLAQYGEIFSDSEKFTFSVANLEFAGAGSSAFNSPCQFAFYRTVSASTD